VLLLVSMVTCPTFMLGMIVSMCMLMFVAVIVVSWSPAQENTDSAAAALAVYSLSASV
jgi:hypothetical protein